MMECIDQLGKDFVRCTEQMRVRPI